MKITKRQLKRIIREAMVTAGTPFSSSWEHEHMGNAEGRGPTNERSGRTSKFAPAPAGEYDEHAGDIDNAEYERGYQDGLDGYPIADDATLDYDAGYEDGILDAHIGDQGPEPTQKEQDEEEVRYAAGRPWEHN